MSNPKKILVEVECDTNRLYGPIDDAILYMQEIAAAHPNTGISLEEEWTGYEDMYMRFQYYRDETAEEIAERERQEEEERKRLEKNKLKEKQRNADLKEFNKLKRKLGI